jgi:hypothetical protein
MEIINKYPDVGRDDYWCENCRTYLFSDMADVECIMCQKCSAWFCMNCVDCAIDVEDGSSCSQCTFCTKPPWKRPDIIDTGDEDSS